MSQDSTDQVLDEGMPCVMVDIRIAEEQIALGDGVEHGVARTQVMSRLAKRSPSLERPGVPGSRGE
jgi:hypothetical protein